jgi:hypothetical protein
MTGQMATDLWLAVLNAPLWWRACAVAVLCALVCSFVYWLLEEVLFW